MTATVPQRHISEARKLVGGKRIDSVDDVLKIGPMIQVELKAMDPRGTLSLGVVLAVLRIPPKPGRCSGFGLGP
jgi:hypothetical protein